MEAGPIPTGRAPSVARVALRVVAHLVAEVPLVVIAALQISKGWLPTSDDAVIAWRTWSVFAGPVPLTGQYTQITATGGHTAFDLGPLQYYLLAIPERIDPVHGILWGAALLAVGLAALSIEAMWSAFGPAGGTFTALALALTAETLVQSTVNLAWNPSTGVYACFAAMAASVAVGCGRARWLPVAVACASLAAQCHTSFALPVVTAIAIGVGIGVAKTRSGWLSAVLVAVVAGVACWIAPLIQQLTGHPGNWSVVLSSIGRHGPTVGFSLGLRGIASATRFPPSWWVRVPAITSAASYGPFEKIPYHGSATWGVAALALCAAIAVAAALTRRPRLAALAAIGAATGVATAWTLGSVPVAQGPYLVYYLYFVLWPVGMTITAALVAAGGTLITDLWRVVSRSHGASHRSTQPTLPGAIACGTGALALAAAGAGLFGAELPIASSPLFLMGWQPVHQTRVAIAEALPLLREHEPAGRHRPFDVEASPNFILAQSAVADAVAYLLVVKGYPARVSASADLPLGAPYRAGAGEPALLVLPGWHGTIHVKWQPGA
ncbi:MAG: hypothetical protein ACLQK4_06315 [Acidimicrobiales bacterium]